MKQIIVFDLDGTLAHTEVYWLPILDRTLEVLERKFETKRSIDQLEEALPLLGKPDDEVFAGLFPGRERAEYGDMIRIANEIWMEMLEDHPYVLYPGALEVVEKLHEAGFEIFVASNCDNLYLRNVLNTGLRPWVKDAACAEMYPGLKKWEFTRKMLAGIGPYEGFFVGDSGSDMKAGRENGLETIYAEYGYGEVKDQSLVDYQAKRIDEVLSIVDRN